jgi:hypothetical protein
VHCTSYDILRLDFGQEYFFLALQKPVLREEKTSIHMLGFQVRLSHVRLKIELDESEKKAYSIFKLNYDKYI